MVQLLEWESLISMKKVFFLLKNLDFVYDTKNNILAVFSYGPAKKGLFSSSS